MGSFLAFPVLRRLAAGGPSCFSEESVSASGSDIMVNECLVCADSVVDILMQVGG